MTGNLYDVIETYMNYKNKLLEVIKKEYESNFDDYRKTKEDEKETYTNKN